MRASGWEMERLRFGVNGFGFGFGFKFGEMEMGFGNWIWIRIDTWRHMLSSVRKLDKS